MKKAKSLKAKASKKGTAVKIVKCEIRGQKVLQTRDEDGHIVHCFWGLTPKQEQAITTSIVKRKQKKRKPKKQKTKYDPQKLFEKLAKAHQKIVNSVGKDKGQSVKRRYHEELAETYAFLAKGGNGEDQEPRNLTRIPPLFKGALIMTLPKEFKRISRRINALEEENEKERKY